MCFGVRRAVGYPFTGQEIIISPFLDNILIMIIDIEIKLVRDGLRNDGRIDVRNGSRHHELAELRRGLVQSIKIEDAVAGGVAGTPVRYADIIAVDALD